MDAQAQERLLDLIEDITGEPEIREERDIDLFEEGYLDSMAGIELLVELEEQFGVSIAPTELEREEMNTVNKIIDRVNERL